MEHFHIRIGEDNGMPQYTKRKVKPKSSFVVNYYFATIQHPMMVLVFSPVRTNVLARTEREPVNNDRSTIFE